MSKQNKKERGRYERSYLELRIVLHSKVCCRERSYRQPKQKFDVRQKRNKEAKEARTALSLASYACFS